MKKNNPTSLAVAACLIAFPLVSNGHSEYLDDFRALYPKASSFGCDLCHAGASEGHLRNAYGRSFRSAYITPISVTATLIKIEPQDSDGDGRTNLTEIAASTDTVAVQPGLRSSIPAKLLFHDNFTNATAASLPNWTKVSGKWIGNGKFLTTAKETVCLANPVRPPALNSLVGGSVAAKIRLNQLAGTSANASVVFNQQSQNKYRYVRIESGRIAIGQVGALGGVAAGVKKTVRRSIGTTFHQFRVMLTAAGLVTVYVDNAKAAVASFKFPKAVAGKVGLLTSKAQTNFDDFTVSN